MPTGVVEYASSFAAQYRAWKESGFKTLAEMFKNVIDSRAYEALMLITVKETK